MDPKQIVGSVVGSALVMGTFWWLDKQNSRSSSSASDANPEKTVVSRLERDKNRLSVEVEDLRRKLEAEEVRGLEKHKRLNNDYTVLLQKYKLLLKISEISEQEFNQYYQAVSTASDPSSIPLPKSSNNHAQTNSNSEELNKLKEELASLQAELEKEREAHAATKQILNDIESELQAIRNL